MTESPLRRIVEIAENGRHLSKERGFLVVAAGGEEIGRVPLDDIMAVIASAPGTTASCALLAELAERGLPFVLCRRNYEPAALLWPIAGHHAQQRRMEAQVDEARRMGKRLWGLVVAAKIRAQGWALDLSGKRSGAFVNLAESVRSGDPGNLEAQAARRYWPLMMGDDFRRDPDGDGANALLNYGYAILRAATARAVVAAGLHPSIGIFHRHPHNALPLADDLMEPFRPVVDLRVRELLDAGIRSVGSQEKRELAAVLQLELSTRFGSTPVSTCLVRLAQSVAESYQSGSPRLDLPNYNRSLEAATPMDSGDGS